MSNKHLIGLKGESFTFHVTLEHIQAFARAIGDASPLYFDEEYAKTTAYGRITAPPTYLIAIGAAGGAIDLQLDQRRMLHGEQAFIYERPIVPGDVLTCDAVVSDVYEKQGKNGTMEFIVLDTYMYDTTDRLVVTSRTNIVYRAAQQHV